MKLSENTVSTIKNFSTINTGMFFKAGNVLRTVSPFKTVLAEATIDETFPSDFGIFDLNQLLSVLSLHKDAPELSIEGNNLVVHGFGGRSKITYRCCDATMIKTPPDKNITLPSEEVSFVLSETDLEWVMKTAGVLASPNIAVVGADGALSLRILDAQNDSANTDTLDLGPHSGANVYFLFKTENWKQTSGTYTVAISSKGVAHFQHQSRKLAYWIATEAKKA